MAWLKLRNLGFLLPTFALLSLIIFTSVQHCACGCPLPTPTLQYNANQLNDIIARGSDFVDLRVGSNWTLTCEGEVLPLRGNSTSNQIEWILPEFHPLFDASLPDYIQIRENITSNGSVAVVRSTLSVTNVETGDVGQYVCLYSRDLNLAEHNLRSKANSIYLFVTDIDNLFVKPMPILTAIQNSSIEIGCRPSSSLAQMKLFVIDSRSGRHIELPYETVNETDLQAKHLRQKANSSILFNQRRGFLLESIINDRFICQARLNIHEDQVNEQDNSIIIQYTNGIEFATQPTISQVDYPYAFVGNNFSLSCQVEKSQSSHIFLKWHLINATCYEPNASSLLVFEDVETTNLRKGRDMVRLNLTLTNVTSAYDGAIFECTISDVSLAQKTTRFPLRVFERPFLAISPLSPISQALRCNRQLKFETKIRAIPNDLTLLSLAWFKDHANQTIPLGDSRVNLFKRHHFSNKSESSNSTDSTAIRAGILIQNLVPEDSGRYTMKASLMDGLLAENVTLQLNVMACHISDWDEGYFLYLIAIGVVLFAMMLFIFLLVNRIRVEKKAKQDLEILSYNLLSNAGVDSKGFFSPLDPNLPVHEQIDLLRYDSRWEFPLENLDFGPILGQGAFGKVYKATAYGLKSCTKAYSLVAAVGENSNDGLEVAVKMLKHYATMDQLKSLLGELKVLNYIGSHVNIVNLLGACTSNLVKGELYVLMEYCCYGNLQHYLMKNRHHFACHDAAKNSKVGHGDEGRTNALTSHLQSADDTNRADHFKHRLAKLLSKNPFEHHTSPRHDISTDLFVSNVKFRCAKGASRSSGDSEEGKEGEEEAQVQFADCQSLGVQDLIDFAFQCASGMQYLASKKLIHRDLAARNVLLARNKIVKICDLGLARDCADYSSSYVKKHDEPLPVKWMAIESLRDKLYTTKTDVWSFGVFLWELFSLGVTPYPGMMVDSQFYQRLVDGYRMEKPKHASEPMYAMMLACWQENPEERPDFEQIVSQLQGEIDPKFFKNYQMVRKSYEEYNLKRLDDQARLCETLQGINSKGSVKSISAHADYIVMTDHFSRQSSQVEGQQGLLFEPHGLTEMNYVQMELPAALEKAISSS